MKRSLPFRLMPVLALLAGVSALLGACASRSDSSLADISTRSPLELVGLTVESADGTRMLGNVNDLILGPDNRVEQVIVTTGAPAYPLERAVAVDSAAFRFAPARNALKLTGMTADRFADLPPAAGVQTMVSMGSGRPDGNTAAAAGPTDWSGVNPR